MVSSAAMPCAADDPLDAFRDVLNRYADANIDALAIDGSGRIPPSLLAALGELGAFGVSLPERFGGAGLGLPGACAVVDTLARHDRSVATTVGLHLGLGTRGFTAFGSPEQQAELLPGLASGRYIAAFAMTEPSAGSDLSGLRTTVTDAGPGRVRVSGHKIFVTNGGLASVVTVAAASPQGGGAGRGQSLVALRSDDDGVRVGSEERKLGLKGSSTAELFFDEVDVPSTRIIGEVGVGKDYIGHLLAWGRTIMSAGCNGTSHAALTRAIARVSERHQFGRALATQPVIRQQIAGMAARLFAAQALVERTGAASEDEPLQLERRSLAAKVFCSQASGQICDTSLQLHGGLGFIEDSGMPLLVRDTRITRIFEGANDVLLTRLGMLALSEGALPTPPSSLVGTLWDEAREALRSRGLKALRDKRALHRLGQLTVLDEVTYAARASATNRGERARVLAKHWAALAAEEAQAVRRAGGTSMTTDLAADAVLDGGLS